MAIRPYLDKLAKHPTVEKLQRRYDQLPMRDRRALQGLTVAIVLALLYVLIWLPISDFRDNAMAEAERAEDRLAWIQSREAQLRQIAAAGDSSRGADLGGGDFLTTVTNSAQNAGLSLQRFEPSGSSSMRIWLEGVAFDELIQWLSHLRSEYGVAVDQAGLERTGDPGRVNARLTLEI